MKRIIPGLVLALFWLFLLLKGTFLMFGAIIVVVAFIGSYEYAQMSLKDETNLFHSSFLSGLFSFPVLWALFRPGSSNNAGLFVSFFLLACYLLYTYRGRDDNYGFMCRLLLGVVYVGFLTSHLLFLHALPNGNLWLIFLVGVTAGSDSAAYFCGRAFGKHKLCPNVSPNKTIEGAIGGLLGAVLISYLLAIWLLPSEQSIYVIALAIPLTVAGILGDLFESVLKRGTGVKDSGTILQGHGGILDRVDSMLFAGPILYYLLVLTG